MLVAITVIALRTLFLLIKHRRSFIALLINHYPVGSQLIRINTGTPDVSDNCDAYPAVTYKDNTDGNGGITRTWTATDACGNYSYCTQHITVEVDKTPPVIDCPADKFLECGASTDPKNTGTPNATDNLDAYPSVTYKDAYGDLNCTGYKPIVRTWTATDALWQLQLLHSEHCFC